MVFTIVNTLKHLGKYVIECECELSEHYFKERKEHSDG